MSTPQTSESRRGFKVLSCWSASAVMGISVCGTSADEVPLLEIGPSYSCDGCGPLKSTP